MDYCFTIQPCLDGEIEKFEIEKFESSECKQISLERADFSAAGEWSQCGEIFIENTHRFLLVCCICKSKFNEMVSFGEHITSVHRPFEKIETMFFDEDANTELDSFQNEASNNQAECAESDDGMSDDMLEELQRIDECQSRTDALETTTTPLAVNSQQHSQQLMLWIGGVVIVINPSALAISSYEVFKPIQISSTNRNDEFTMKKINLPEEENWTQSDVRSEEVNDEDAFGDATEHTSTFSTKGVPENCVEGEFDCEDSMSDDFRDLYKQIGEEIEAEKSLLDAKEDHPKYFCTICRFQYTSRNYSFHMKVNHGILSKQMKAKLKRGESIPPWNCQVCEKIFHVKDALVRHLTTHTGERPHKCPYCPRAFASSTNLSTHIRIHLGIKKHKCSYCDKRYVTSSGKVLHERSHTKAYPFQCEECGKLFRHVHNLKDHATIHTDIIYDCPNCPKQFKRKEQLRAHKATHRRLNLSCEICKRVFQSQKNLRIHMDIHSTEKKYVCSCGKAYSQYSGLYSHKKTHSECMQSGHS